MKNTKFEKGNLEQLKSLEWLETNGLGGWAMGTLSGMNTRKYHSWLTSSFNPPTDRQVVIPKLTESISLGNDYYELDSNEFNHNTVHPSGYLFLHSFVKDFYPEWTFKTPLGELKRSLIMPNGKNKTIIKYEYKGEKEVHFHIRPYHIFRDIHGLYKPEGYLYSYESLRDGVIITDKASKKRCAILLDKDIEVNKTEHIYENVTYSEEVARGYDAKENWCTLGYLALTLKPNEVIYVTLTTEDSFNGAHAPMLFEKEVERRKALVKSTKSEFEKQLFLSADQFIVERGESKSIIAGYPWFTDWGRDTMISLPGLALVTGRYEEAREILVAFKDVLQDGLIPNRFVETGSVPEYNTIDATLWFVVAIYQYHKYSGRSATEFFPAIESIIENHIKGTRYHIKMTSDALLSGGEEGWQLTWMDAKLDGHVVTPRRGKAVEINALWYNVLKIAAEFGVNSNEDLESLAKKCKSSFNRGFVKPEGGLYDVIGDDFKDETIRPNQVFAGGLPFKVINKQTALEVVKEVEQKLLTPHGLRTLPQSHPEYVPICRGDLHFRDYGYHQGTTWMWLWGAYASTKLYSDHKKGSEVIKKQLKQIEKHFQEAGIGSLSEVFDGDKPHLPGGCPAQAWSVAEVLRILHDLPD